MPPPDKHRHDHADDDRHGKKHRGAGPKEKEIAAALTAATVTLAADREAYPTLDVAGDAVAAIYARMFALVGDARPEPPAPQ